MPFSTQDFFLDKGRVDEIDVEVTDSNGPCLKLTQRGGGFEIQARLFADEPHELAALLDKMRNAVMTAAISASCDRHHAAGREEAAHYHGTDLTPNEPAATIAQADEIPY